MTITPFTVEGFGGLNLVDDQFEIGAQGATDLKNVMLTHGRVQTAPTVASFATATRTVIRLGVHKTQLLSSQADGTNVTLQAFSLAGSSVASTTYASANTYGHSFASVGTSSTSASYAVRAGDTTRKWSGSAWSTVASIPSGRCCAPADFGSRLAVGNGGGEHRVEFSNAGDPETFGVDDYVDIAPGDGETICALVSWGGMLFAFKNTKFAVFYATSVDADGGAVFNYRLVDTGVGVGTKGIEVAPGAACAAGDGVYFIAADGVYRTTGGAPEMVSRAIAPVWKPNVYSANTTVPRASGGFNDEISAVGGMVFVTVVTYGGSPAVATFVLNEGQWSFWDIQANALGNFVRVQDRTVFSTGGTGIKELDFLTGPSTSLAWSYKSGRYPLADAGTVAVSVQSSVVGSGTVALRLDSDLYSNQNGSATLGTAPATAEGWPAAVDQEGTWLQHTLSGTGAATVSRLTHYVSSTKPVGVR